MHLLWQGAFLGLSLSILAGPMLFILIQLGIEKGFRAGATAGFGVWTSDTLYVLSAYLGISYLLQLTQWQGFKLWASIAGGLILIIIGTATLLARPAMKNKDGDEPSHNWTSYWLKGFFVNTFNPFTAFFWIGIMTTVSADGPLSATDAGLFFGSIIGVIIITDLMKVLLAKRIQNWMQYSYLLAMRRVSGTALVLFGVVLMFRGMM